MSGLLSLIQSGQVESAPEI